MARAASASRPSLAGKQLFMFFASGRGEQTVEKEVDGVRHEVARRELEALQRARLRERLHGREEELHGEGGVHVGPDLAGELPLLDEAAEDVRDVALADVDQQLV